MNKFFRAFIVLVAIANLSACAAVTEFSSSTSSIADAATPDITLDEFVKQRYVAIRQDAANGGGENLDALAQLLGEKDKNNFAKKMKNNFDSVFRNVSHPLDIISRIETQMIIKKI